MTVDHGHNARSTRCNKLRYMNIEEVARYLGFSKHTIYGWTSQRVIPFIRVGGRLRFDMAQLDDWMREHAIQLYGFERTLSDVNRNGRKGG